MKKTKNARAVREDEARRRREQWTRKAPAVPEEAPAPSPGQRTRKTREPPRSPAPKPLSPEEQAELEAAETLEFLAYLEKDIRVPKEGNAPTARNAGGGKSVGTLNLEAGMPTVEEAVGRLRVGLQEMRSRGVRIVRLIHGYGSTGKGGRLRVGVRDELARMKRQRRIADFIPGEDFGPFGEAGRRLVDRFPAMAKDPDFGKCNQGITMVAL